MTDTHFTSLPAKLAKAALLTAFITGFAAPALAGSPGLDDSPYIELTSLQDMPVKTTSTLPRDATIAVARLDGGRLIPTPHAEAFDWTLLARRTGTSIKPLQASQSWKYIPEIPFEGVDTDNKIDEIRLTAANEGYSHVILYGLGPDARWSSFGRKALVETGLTVSEDCESWKEARAKALIVDSFTGEVVGAATTDNVDFHIGALADAVESEIKRLST